MGHTNFVLDFGDIISLFIVLYAYIFLFSQGGDVMSPLGYSRMITSHSKVPVSTRARGGCE